MPSGIYTRTESARQNMSKAKLGRRPSYSFPKGFIPWNKNKKTGIVPKSAFTAGLIPWNKGMVGFQAQENHPNWKGGISRNKHSLSEPKYRKWRIAVFQRDGYTCQECHVVGVRLEAHHIKSWARFPELRYEIENGKALCVPCHAKTDNYKNKKPKQ